MSTNVFREVSASQGIFKNEDALSPEFTPEKLPGRESQERELASWLEPAGRGARPSNVFLFGPSGTGKTSVCRHVLRQLKEYSDKPVCLYVNCWQHATRQGVLAQLAQAIGEPIPRRGVAADEIFERVCKRLKFEKRVPIVVLDEADRLFIGGEDAVLYDFSRASEVYGVHFGVILVSNDFGLLAKAEGRVRSSLSPREIEFKPYSPTELKAILAERVKEALMPKACSDEVIGLCAAHGAKSGGDARVALQSLWLSAKAASLAGRKQLSVEDAKEAFSKTKQSVEQKRERDSDLMPAGEKAIIDLLKSSGGKLLSSDLYAAFEKQGLGSERSVRNYLAALEGKKLVESSVLENGRRQVKLVGN